MDDTSSTPTLAPQPRSTNSRPWAWLFASLIVTLAISLAAAHAPPRIRLIGLFSIAFGLLIGWVLNRLAAKLEANVSRPFICVVAAVLTLGGLIGSTCEVVRLEILSRPTSPNEGIALRMIEEMEAQSKPTDALQLKTTSLVEFRKHLAYRIRKIGEWSSPWPELFWSAELLASALASLWISIRYYPTIAQTSL